MAIRKRKFGVGATEAQPLRGNSTTADLDTEQERLLGALLVGAVVGGLGIYTKRNERSGLLNVKFYDGDESFADALYPHEITIELLDDFAKKLGFQPHFRAIVATTKPD